MTLSTNLRIFFVHSATPLALQSHILNFCDHFPMSFIVTLFIYEFYP